MSGLSLDCGSECPASNDSGVEGRRGGRENYYAYNELAGELPADAAELSFYFVFYKLTVPLLFSFVALFGVTGNLLVIYVVLSTTDMRRNTVNVLLVNLAVRSASGSHARFLARYVIYTSRA